MEERDELYIGREQSLAKHEILRRYLEVLARKVGRFRPGLTLNYIDGFAGPWESRADDLRDTSPAIALAHLGTAREQLAAAGIAMRVRTFFVAVDRVGADRLRNLGSRFEHAEISVEVGPFERTLEAARRFIRDASNGFTFIFIDHTGWRGFGLRAIEPLLHEGRTEVLINFMTAFISRFMTATTAATNPRLWTCSVICRVAMRGVVFSASIAKIGSSRPTAIASPRREPIGIA